MLRYHDISCDPAADVRSGSSCCSVNTGIPILQTNLSKFTPRKLSLSIIDLNYRPPRSCGKVIFSQACVKNSIHRGGGGHMWQGVCIAGGMCGRGVCSRGACVAGGARVAAEGMSGGGGAVHGRGACVAEKNGNCSRWYASYWNAFLFVLYFLIKIKHLK